MSRIGKKPIPIPEKVTVQMRNSTLEVKGGSVALTREIPPELSVQVEDRQVILAPKNGMSTQTSALYGLTRTLIANMVQGIVQPWKKDLEIQGVGYRASKEGQILVLQLGYSHPIHFKLPELVQFSVDPKQTSVSLSSPDKELLGVVAAKIRSFRPPEPYKGKGIRYSNEIVQRKVGKAAGVVGSGAAGGGKK